MFDLKYLESLKQSKKFVIHSIDFTDTIICNKIFNLAKQNNYYVGDLEILLLQKYMNISLSKKFMDENKLDCYAYNKNYKGYVLYQNSHLIGFVIYYIAPSNYDNIHFILIDKTYHKQGFGTILLKKVIDNSQSLFLKINKPEPSSIEFYKKNGFCRINDIVKRSPDFDILVKMLLTSIKTNTDLKIDDINQIAIMSHLFDEPETNLYYLK